MNSSCSGKWISSLTWQTGFQHGGSFRDGNGQRGSGAGGLGTRVLRALSCRATPRSPCPRSSVSRGQPEPAPKAFLPVGWSSGCANHSLTRWSLLYRVVEFALLCGGVCFTGWSIGNPSAVGVFAQLPLRGHHGLPTHAHVRGRELLGGEGGKWEKALPRKTLAPQLGGA